MLENLVSVKKCYI